MSNDKTRRIVRWEHFGDLDEFISKKDDDEDVFLADEENFQSELKVMPVAITPVGPIPMSPNSLSSSFNLWILHSNFKFTKGDIKKICDTEGVEAVTVFSRYRLRILIAELFNTDEVMSEVEENLGCEITFSKDIELTPELLDRIELVTSKLKENRHYLIYALPNGQLKSFSSNELNSELSKQIDIFQSTYKAVGGYLILSSSILKG